MRKLLLLICSVALVALVLSAVGGKTAAPAGDEPKFSTVSEAAFSMRRAGAEDATSRLVGSFVGEHGEKLNFNGSGEVRRVMQNLSSVTGSYSLLQSADGAAILDMNLNSGEGLYSFAVTSPEGQITLTDADGSAHVFNPVP